MIKYTVDGTPLEDAFVFNGEPDDFIGIVRDYFARPGSETNKWAKKFIVHKEDGKAVYIFDVYKSKDRDVTFIGIKPERR